jgi:Flp pilus assembly protein CpaB
VTAPIVGGEVVSSTRIAPDGVDGLAALVPAGRRAVAVPTGGTGLRVDVGDRVDVLGTSDGATYGDDSSRSSTVLAAGAVVLAVGDAAVTVAVDRDDAPVLARALAAGTPVLALAGADPDG